MKIHLPVTTVVSHISLCAGMAAHVSSQVGFVTVIFNAMMALMNPTNIPIVIIVQKSELCPAQAFLGTVGSFVMVGQRAQTSGTNYSPPANQILITMPMIQFVVRRQTFTGVKTDPCV